MTMTAHIGYTPWDVLHSGLSTLTGISFGLIAILTGLLILCFAALMGQKIGLASILNMVLIGFFIDWLIRLNIIPAMHNLVSGTLFFIAGLFMIAFGSYFYIRAGYGAGPRDYLMIIVHQRTQLPVGLSRVLIEGATVVIGWALGGPVGGGTALSAIGISVCVQAVFSLMKFDPSAVQHETLQLTCHKVRTAIGRRISQRT